MLIFTWWFKGRAQWFTQSVHGFKGSGVLWLSHSSRWSRWHLFTSKLAHHPDFTKHIQHPWPDKMWHSMDIIIEEDCLNVLATPGRHVASLICKFPLLRIRYHNDLSPQNTVHQSGDNVQGIIKVTLVNFLEMGFGRFWGCCDTWDNKRHG